MPQAGEDSAGEDSPAKGRCGVGPRAEQGRVRSRPTVSWSGTVEMTHLSSERALQNQEGGKPERLFPRVEAEGRGLRPKDLWRPQGCRSPQHAFAFIIVGDNNDPKAVKGTKVLPPGSCLLGY